MATLLESNKVKIARRVIEVLEYFGADRSEATVMDIVRRYGRPQSSTSELLTSLVELGLLYKNPVSRSYTPTPRLATLGNASQPELLRDGRLFALMDRLAQSTRYGVALCGMVGLHTQIFRWSPGAEMDVQDLCTGASALISSSAAGLLLLSTQGRTKAQKVLWRLQAEAPPSERFDYIELSQRTTTLARQRFATGNAGFAEGAQITSVLLPSGLNERPLALGVIYPDECSIDEDALLATLRHGLAQCSSGELSSMPGPPATLMRAVWPQRQII